MPNSIKKGHECEDHNYVFLFVTFLFLNNFP